MNEAEHCIEHHEAHLIIDFFQLALHNDMGGDHLESFETSSELSISAPCICTDHLERLRVLLSMEHEDEVNFIPIHNDYLPKVYFVNKTSFRGPPAV